MSQSEFYLIDGIGGVCAMNVDWELAHKPKEIGNYFLTEKEAEDAVQRLRAWKGLKDKGFKITGWWMPQDGPARIVIEATCVPDTVEELNALFGYKEVNEQYKRIKV